MTKVSDGQRALVLQGGGSLGAYEAGAYQAIYERITKIDREKGENNKPFLNIVAGTSIGAINAAIIVSYAVENGTWDGSAERLNEFWEYVSKESSVDLMPGVTGWWDYLHNNVHSGIASGEAARRYYSAKEFAITGVPSVFSPLIPLVDARFFDFQKVWYRFDSRPLKRSLERFAKFPIATSFDEKSSLPQPRLLLVSVDVAEGAAVTFDSYGTEDGSRKSEYGKYIVQKGKEVGHKHIIRYNDGITSEHVIASASVPINYDYTTLEVESYNDNTTNYEKNIRYFWDGGIMSNTPLTQLVRLHRLYWLKVKGLRDTVPRLDIGIVNVHPVRQDAIPLDHDGVINRNNDITFSDRTEREQEALLLASDYVDLARKLINIAKNYGAKENIINDLLNSKTMNHGLAMKPRKYSDILVGQFEIGNIIRVNRKNDQHTISDKVFDFSHKTIKELRENGYNNTMDLSDVEFS
ncbi:MAG TPA: patatin-like phospholipase family protein [Candidatus Bathyarchaeia archaeon]|nr:patatin-like phospholipase family protein [Candidatus Bathyarchaeia archaeon]